VRLRLLRDVLGVPADDECMNPARLALDSNPHVRLLAAEQRGDGGWGPFHSRSTLLKQKTISTEFGVERALALGLDTRHPILALTRDYIAGLLAAPAEFPDYAEKNDRWATGLPMILAGTLAQFEPGHPAIEPVRRLWIELAARIFATGDYDADAEVRAHRELTGATVADSYMVIDNRYAVAILSSQPAKLPAGLAQAYLKWLAGKPGGIGYLEVAVGAGPAQLKPGPLDRWFCTLAQLARFPGWSGVCAVALDRIVGLRAEDGLWDLGPRGSSSSYFLLSASWRRRICRRHDWTVRVLALLAKA
jgi:hypothetical protein